MNKYQFKPLTNLYENISIQKKFDENINNHKENLINFFMIYILFYKYNLNDEKQIQIYPFYKDGIYIIKITKENKLIFENEIKCNKIEAKLLTELICDDFIKNNEIKLSSICLLRKIHEYQFTYLDNPDMNSLRIRSTFSELITPFYNGLSKMHEIALKKMNDDFENTAKIKKIQKNC